jgi:small conductance mechanosensitive channel
MIPNGKIADSSIINYSSKSLRRLDMFFNVQYNCNLDDVKKAILESVKKSNMYKQNITPFINIEEYKESSIKIVLKVWCDNKKYWDLYYFLQEEVIRQFEKYEIDVPYNMMNVTLLK